MTTTLIVVLALGLVIGALLGLLGGGGSILAVPALVYGGRPAPRRSRPHLIARRRHLLRRRRPPRLRQVQWRLAAIFAATGAAAAFAGTALNRLLDPSVVLLGFAAVMVVAALRMLRGSDDAGGSCALPGGGVNWRSCLPKAAASGIAVGFLTGLFGVGGGFLIVPALTLLLGLPMATAAATSLVVIVANSAAAFTAHLGDTPINLTTAVAFTLTAIIGSLTAGRLATRLPSTKIRRWFAYLVLAVAAYTAAQATLTVLS